MPVTPSPPPIFSLFCPVRGARHSARRAASSGTSFSPVNAVSATRSVERNLLLASERCVGNAQRRAEPPTNTSVSARMQTPLPHSGLQRKKILLLHRRTIAYEPRPNISPRPLRPRTSSAGRGRLHAPSSAPIRGIRGDTPRPAPEGAPGNPRHRRFLPSFGPWRGWLLLPDLYRHFRIPSNCSLLTANC